MLHSPLAGCDISSRRLDVCLLCPDGARDMEVANDTEGIAALVAAFERAEVGLVVIEASGGYEAALLEALWAAGLAVSRVPADRVRHFAKAGGERAKTDRIDARVLAEYGRVMAPPPTPARDDLTSDLRALVARRRHLVEVRAAELTRQRRGPRAIVRDSYGQVLSMLAGEIAALEAAIRETIAACRDLARRAAILRSMPGIGPATTGVLLAEVPELGRLRKGQPAALLGLAPHDRSSGRWQGKRFISGGRKPPRDALYMAASTVVFRTETGLRRHYDDLRARGKPHKVALVAVMRKMIEILNAMLKENQTFRQS